MVMALLMVLYPGDITPRQEIPEPIPYDDCVEMAGRMALYFDKVYVWDQPVVECEVQNES